MNSASRRMCLSLLLGLMLVVVAWVASPSRTWSQQPTFVQVKTPQEPQPGEVRTNPKDGMEMVWVPGGEFLMGTDPEEIATIWQRYGWKEAWKQWVRDESPRHRVGVDGFWMGRYEVTVAQYRRFCQATGREMMPQPEWNRDNHPVVNVSWNDAAAYCAWAGVRLPTEAEWEYAARGGNTGLDGKPRYVFVWGDELPTGQGRYGNLADENRKRGGVGEVVVFEGYDDGYGMTSPVGQFEANGFGLYDMAGNVWEWCQDWYQETFYAECAKQGVVRNPVCREAGTMRVLRGGSWFNVPLVARAAYRSRSYPGYWYEYYGMRVAASRLE